MTVELAQPKWTEGYDLAWLKDAAKVFKQAYKAHTYGAFGLPKEIDLAQARKAGSLIWKSDLSALAIGIVLKSISTHKDFADRCASIQAGDIFIRHIAGAPAGMAELIEHVHLKAPKATVWVEGHVENHDLVAMLARLAFVKVMTKISASSDLKGLWLRGDTVGRMPAPLAEADAVSCHIVQREFITEDEQAAILEEAESAGQWAQHYSGYNKGKTWTAFAIQGFDADDPSFIIKPAEMSKKWKAENAARLTAKCGPTVIAEKFPTALKVAGRIPGGKERVRFMRLAAKGGELTRHADITDPDAGTRDGQLCRLHVPLRSAEECLFHSWGLDGEERKLHFAERALCYLDTRKPHAVTNPAEIERVHLVMDTFASPELRAMLTENG